MKETDLNIRNMTIEEQLRRRAERIAPLAQNLKRDAEWLYAVSMSSSEGMDAMYLEFLSADAGYIKKELKSLCKVLAQAEAGNA